MSTFKDAIARTLLLESYLDDVIDDDEFILLCDETFSKNPEFPYEFIIIIFFFAIMTSKFKNTETTHWTLLVPLQCCSSRFQFHIDLELPFCQLCNKQLQFSSSFQRPLPISSLSQLCSFVPLKGSTTMISRHNIWFWRELHTTGFLKKLEFNSSGAFS